MKLKTMFLEHCIVALKKKQKNEWKQKIKPNSNGKK